MQKNTLWKTELELLAAIINKAQLEKTIKWGAEVFMYNRKNVVTYGGFKQFFSLWFFNGVFIKDTFKVLINASKGKTKSLRQWRFTSAKEIDEKKILNYINQAIEIEKKGLQIKPDKYTEMPLPSMLAKAFNSDKHFKSTFEKLTTGKQKEYINYINEAKQEVTKIKRIEKIKPLITAGIGLNDKYK